MESLSYFAYGSNMLAERLQRRCRSARFVAVGMLEGYVLSFGKKSTDGSGKATLVPSSGTQAFGVVFEVAKDDLEELDRIEGRGKGYDRFENIAAFSVPDRKPLLVTMYVAAPGFVDPALQPYDWYLALVVKGAERKGLPEAYRRKLISTPARADPDPSRPSRLQALDVLAKLEDRA